MKKYRPSSCMACGGKKMYYQDGGMDPQHGNIHYPMNTPVDSIEIPHGAPDTTTLKPYGTAQQQIHDGIYRPKKLPFNLETLIREGVTAGEFISGIAERNRNKQYEATQSSTLGQRNAMPATDFQPSPYSLYAKYGGSLKNHIKRLNEAKFSNNAWMNMGDVRENYNGKMQVGGLTRGLIPQPSYNFPYDSSVIPGQKDSLEYLSNFNKAVPNPGRYKRRVVDPAWGAYANAVTMYSSEPGSVGESIQRMYKGEAMMKQNPLGDALNVMTPAEIQAELHRSLATPKDVTRKYQGGGSIVDYLSMTGRDSSFDARKKIFASRYGNEHYTGTAEQNTRLLGALRDHYNGPTTDVSKTVLAPRPTRFGEAPSTDEQVFGMKPTKIQVSSSSKGSTRGRSLSDISQALSVAGRYDNSTAAAAGSASFQSPKRQPLSNLSPAEINNKLESGTIFDKRKNIGYIIQNNKITRKFPILTGVNPDLNDPSLGDLENHPERRNTPVGTYKMEEPSDWYGRPGFTLNSIPAYGEPAKGNAFMGAHYTYDSTVRNKLYNTPGSHVSYGCVNLKGKDLEACLAAFPHGDTSRIVDTKFQEGQDVINQYRPIKKKGGNWIPKDLHKGRCTPAPNPDCPVGSPQYNLAQTFKKHHGFHKKK